jgi:hypothetical protein
MYVNRIYDRLEGLLVHFKCEVSIVKRHICQLALEVMMKKVGLEECNDLPYMMRRVFEDEEEDIRWLSLKTCRMILLEKRSLSLR